MNRLELVARIAEVAAPRQTPAGIAVVDLVLEHESAQAEAGAMRQVKASLRAVALGPVAQALMGQAVGSELRFTGFLANPRGGKHPRLHVQHIETQT